MVYADCLYGWRIMTDAGWAERMIQFLESVMPLPVQKRRDALVKLSALLDTRRKAEHASAVRILNKLEANALDKQEPECTRCYLQGIRDAKTALQRGRGGKG